MFGGIRGQEVVKACSVLGSNLQKKLEDALKVLLEHFANPNAETEDGVGVDVNVTAGGATPLHIDVDIGRSLRNWNNNF
ncbi:unnamed protein product [Dovyalis caffra]|uniref:Uncharacterized protein n=1 Tax=Dovyalis caffra TaxID=77055 RepID=A0AAV1RNC9_9ROSI|nr:unnamed protein product [Dovyalis caffra]